jgi:hypothetical protein
MIRSEMEILTLPSVEEELEGGILFMIIDDHNDRVTIPAY